MWIRKVWGLSFRASPEDCDLDKDFFGLRQVGETELCAQSETAYFLGRVDIFRRPPNETVRYLR